jgi:hypothetical protein
MSREVESEAEHTGVGGDEDAPVAGDVAGSAGNGDTGTRGRRDIAVPLRLYKTVTVFSTLIAVVSVVAGFVLLDAATLQFSVLRRLLVAALGAVGIVPAGDVLSALLATAGLLVIGLGAGVYVVGARFHPADMGKSQEDSGVESDNG